MKYLKVMEKKGHSLTHWNHLAGEVAQLVRDLNENCPQRLTYLDTWSAVDGAVWGTLRKWRVARGSVSLGAGSISLLPVCD